MKPGSPGLPVCLLVLLCWMPGFARSLDCPDPPEQVRREVDADVRAEVAKLGPAKGAQFEARLRLASRDLMGRLPGADRVYLEQMMFSAYCTALRDDPGVPAGAKARLILDYRSLLERSLRDARQ